MILFFLLFSTAYAELPFPNLPNRTLFIIGDIARNETFEVFFFKEIYTNLSHIAFYENTYEKKFLPGWYFDYYIINNGFRYQGEFIKENGTRKLGNQIFEFEHPIYLINSTYKKHIYTEPDVKIKYKIWHTNNTLFDGSKYLYK